MSWLPKGAAQDEMTRGMVVRYVFTKKPGELKETAPVDELELFGIILDSKEYVGIPDDHRVVAFPAIRRVRMLPAAELYFVDEEMGN